MEVGGHKEKRLAKNGAEIVVGVAALTVVYRRQLQYCRGLEASIVKERVPAGRGALKQEVLRGLRKYMKDLEHDIAELDDQLEIVLIELGIPEGSTMLDDAPYQRRRIGLGRWDESRPGGEVRKIG